MTQAFGKYQLEKKLATGGMAEVWLARQKGIEGFNRHVVIKRILPHLAEDPDFVQMFLNEAKIASRFNHPNIGQIYDLGETNGTYFIAMEFIHGEDLGRVMRRAYTTNQWVARPLAIRIIADACAGLHYAHTRTDDQGKPLKVVHRDISPQNILISFDGSAKLVDFGIAKAADQASNTQSGALKGKFAYMSPEQAGGKPLDARADVFALGLVLYELITGVRPLKRESELATLQAALECAIDAPSVAVEVPSEIDDVVMKALAKSPDDRYATARQFQMALEQVLVAEGTVATSVQVSELMEQLFADRLEEEARSGAPAPASASSISHVAIPEEPPAPAPNQTLDGEPDQPDDRDEPRPRASPPAPEPSRSGSGEPPPRFTKELSRSEAPQPVRPSTERPATVEFDYRSSRSGVSGVSGGSGGSNAGSSNRTDNDLEPAGPRGDDLSGGGRRTTGSGSISRSRGSSSMPDAPVRTSRSHAVKRKKKQRLSSESNQALEAAIEEARVRRLKSIRNSLIVLIVLVGGLGGVGYVFRAQLANALKTPGRVTEGVPVLLTVTSNPPTKVTVVPPGTALNRERLELGFTSLDRVPGANVGDTIVLTNIDRGIHFEQVIDSGKANDVKVIDKVFKQVKLRVRTKPSLKNATVWMNSLQLGRVGTSIEVYEGLQTLEIRADGLTRPVEFHATIDGDKALNEEEVDVSEAVPGKDR